MQPHNQRDTLKQAVIAPAIIYTVLRHLINRAWLKHSWKIVEQGGKHFNVMIFCKLSDQPMVGLQTHLELADAGLVFVTIKEPQEVKPDGLDGVM